MEGAQIHINFLAVFVSSILAFVVGFLWYGPIFGKTWVKEMGFTEESLKKSNYALIFSFAFGLTLIIALNLSAFLGSEPNLVWGMTAGALAGIGWVSTSLGITYLFGRKSLKLFFIDAGYSAVTYTLMGAILGVWK
ncbi:MAG: DUF1761 domain-containing protein [Chlorobiaceae bacterium]|nr:DUF1761 domain-containing protein [Chlorobiaceae bacterium]MBA4309195.1 DUF1761 domain-containing protein [Chlorobiaceae bacterium]